MTLDINDTEVVAFMGEILGAPTMATLDLSQNVEMGNFADRDVVTATDPGADYVVAPPVQPA